MQEQTKQSETEAPSEDTKERSDDASLENKETMEQTGYAEVGEPTYSLIKAEPHEGKLTLTVDTVMGKLRMQVRNFKIISISEVML